MTLPVRVVTPPAVLTGKENGKLPDSILVGTPGLAGGPMVRLVSPAARAWKALTAAASAFGHTLKATSLYDSYRPYEVQKRIFLERYTREMLDDRPWKLWDSNGDGVKERWYQKPGTAMAATPGSSNHGLGLAVDTGEERDGDLGTESIDSATLTWLVANEQRFGFSHEVQSEPWHVRYWAGDAIPSAVLAYEKGQDMPLSDEDVRKIWTWDLKDGEGTDPAYKVVNRTDAGVADLQKRPPVQAAPLSAEDIVAIAKAVANELHRRIAD